MAKKRKDAKRSWYWVCSGDLEWLGKAETEKEALDLALETQTDAALAPLIEVHALQHDPTYYETKSQMEKRGWTVKEK